MQLPVKATVGEEESVKGTTKVENWQQLECETNDLKVCYYICKHACVHS